MTKVSIVENNTVVNVSDPRGDTVVVIRDVGVQGPPAGGPGGPQTYSQYVYNSSTPQELNRYNDWQDLVDAINDGQGGMVTINFEQNETIPAGTYDLPNVIWSGNNVPAGGLTVTFGEGAKLTPIPSLRIDNALFLVNGSSEPVLEVDNGFRLELDNASVISATTAPLVRFFGTNEPTITLGLASRISAGSGVEPLHFEDDSNATVVIVKPFAAISNNSISGEATATLNIILGIDAPQTNIYTLTLSTFLGSINKIIQPDSKYSRYSNSSSGLSSVNVQDAIDELAGSTGSGAVDSVNGQTGIVELDAIDIPFDPTELSEASSGSFDATNTQGIIDQIGVALVNEAQSLNNNKISTSEKGQANGVATLDVGGKVPVTQLPSSIMQYQGTWDASTNTPSLVDGTGDAGDVYIVSVAGSQNLGSGSISFGVGDWVIYNGAVWQKSDNTDAVSTVFGRTGAVVAQAGDYSKSDVGLGSVDNVQQLPASYLDTDGTLTSNSDVKVASQKATKTYADTKIASSVISSNGKGYANHGATASTARPSGFASIEWFGSVEPTNMANGDTWIRV